MGLRLLNPYLTSRAMNSSSVARCRQDQDPILSSSPQISGFPSSAARLTLLDRYESYGTQRSAIRGNSLRYLESSPLFSHKHGQLSLHQTQAEWLRHFETQFSRRSAMRIMYGTTTPALRLPLQRFSLQSTAAMSSHCLWQLPPQRADRPPQYSPVSNLISDASDDTRARDAFVEKHWSFMDPLYDWQYTPTPRMEPPVQHAAPLNPQIHQAEEQRQPATASTPPTQRTDLSRPRDFGAFIASTSIHRTQSTGLRYRRDLPTPGLAASRPKRRPRPLDQELLHEPMNATLLYPQMSPYSQPDDDIGHTTFDYYPRSVSQPVTPRLGETTTAEHDIYATALPSHGPPMENQLGSAGFSTGDAAFNDEHEFRLFVEATAGLGPIASIDDQMFVSNLSGSQPVEIRASHREEPHPFVSPIAETPNTVQALQHLAQMPQGTHDPQPVRPELQRFGSNFDDWLESSPAHPRLSQQHSMPQMSAHAPFGSWQDIADSLPIEDELPDYAASQAQAQAAQRVEATRRAQELQRRWQESGSHVLR